MSSIVGIISALTAALLYGGADFAGGVATRKLDQFQVLLMSVSVSVLPLLLLGLLWRETIPSTASLVFAALAGAFGSLGMAMLYRGLASNGAAIVSPTAAVVGASLPLVYGSLTEGLPAAPRMAGFLLALAGIWLVARPHPASLPGHRRGLLLGLLAGINFGAYFIFIAQAPVGEVFFPLTVVKLASIPVALTFMALRRVRLPSLAQSQIAMVSGIMDSTGNVLFLIARQYSRLDVAAVLVSLYPAVTVLLARLVYKEVISRSQWLGLAMCLAAIGLIVY